MRRGARHDSDRQEAGDRSEEAPSSAQVKIDVADVVAGEPSPQVKCPIPHTAARCWLCAGRDVLPLRVALRWQFIGSPMRDPDHE